MRQLRRVTALLVNLMFVQLALAGTGTPCAADAAPAGTHGAMSSERMASAPAAGEAHARSFDGAAAGDHAPCSAPCMPGSGGCARMSSCAAPMLVEQPATLAASLGSTRAVTASATAPYSVAPAPDVPPPRA